MGFISKTIYGLARERKDRYPFSPVYCIINTVGVTVYFPQITLSSTHPTYLGEKGSVTVEGTKTEILIEKAGMVLVQGNSKPEPDTKFDCNPESPLAINIGLRQAHDTRPIRISETIPARRLQGQEWGGWHWQG